MKRVLVILAIVCAASACSDDDSPTAPSADNPRFIADLSAANETPPVTNAESTVSGTANITFNLGRDGAGNITSSTATFQVFLFGLPAGSMVDIAHIHPGRVGVAGPVLVDTTLAAGQVTVTNGAAEFTKANISVPVDRAQAIIADPAAYYFNVHSTLNPGGVARGQLVRN
jgi:CHRD domain-containing protein